MNYLSHARDLLDRPFAVAGSGVPDWLRILDRRARIATADLPASNGREGSAAAEILLGMRRHLEEDARFHGREVFRKETGEITARIRADHPEPALRASVYGHLLLEILLDAWLIETRPGILDAYYDALESVDPALVEASVSAIVAVPTVGLARLYRRFVTSRFLAGYPDDKAVVARMDMVGARLRQPPLPKGFEATVAWARDHLQAAAPALLFGPRTAS